MMKDVKMLEQGTGTQSTIESISKTKSVRDLKVV